MSHAICYMIKHQRHIVRYANDDCRLLVEGTKSTTKSYLWGRRPHEIGHLPIGATLWASHLANKHYDLYFPRIIDIRIHAFAERDHSGEELWFKLLPHQRLQGVILTQGKEQRFYIMNIIPEKMSHCCRSWPSISYHFQAPIACNQS